jgi:hypothetical protein
MDGLSTYRGKDIENRESIGDLLAYQFPLKNKAEPSRSLKLLDGYTAYPGFCATISQYQINTLLNETSTIN